MVEKEKTGVSLIAQERKRQIEEEGWSREHDLIANKNGELALAAAAYAVPEAKRFGDCHPDKLFPLAEKWWKPSPEDRIKELSKAGALIAAEIDRLLQE